MNKLWYITANGSWTNLCVLQFFSQIYSINCNIMHCRSLLSALPLCFDTLHCYCHNSCSCMTPGQNVFTWLCNGNIHLCCLVFTIGYHNCWHKVASLYKMHRGAEVVGFREYKLYPWSLTDSANETIWGASGPSGGRDRTTCLVMTNFMIDSSPQFRGCWKESRLSLADLPHVLENQALAEVQDIVRKGR